MYLDSFYCHKGVVAQKSCHKHQHSVFEIVYQLSGQNTTLINGSAYIMRPSDVLVIPPNTFHEIPSGEEFTDLYFQTDKLCFDSVIKISDVSGEILSALNLLNSVLIEKKKYYLKICENLKDCIELLILEYLNISHKYPFAEKLQSELNENISNCEFCVSKAIEKTGYNEDYVRRCFKEIYEKTPLEYLTEMRIKKSKSLLLQPCRLSILEIAISCGFSDPLYFSKCFKIKCGMSPRNYRNLYMKKR